MYLKGPFVYIIGGHSIADDHNEESRLIERLDTRTNRIDDLFYLNNTVPCYDVDCLIADIDAICLSDHKIDQLCLNTLPIQ
jgi:hypothetical protein